METAFEPPLGKDHRGGKAIRSGEDRKMRAKAHFTLERLLDEVLYKEEVQDLLEEYGESQSGQKPELVKRLLESMRLQSNSVDAIVRKILDGLPAAELKDLGHRLNIELPSSRDGMVRHLMKHVDFAPYVRTVERECPVCKDKTIHELHFGLDWRASYFRCTTCNKEIDVQAESRSNEPPSEGGSQSETPATKGQGMSPETEYTLKMFENMMPSIHRAEQQSKATLDMVLSAQRVLEPPSLAVLGGSSTMLEATRLKEERESRKRVARHQKRSNLWTIDTIVLALGFGIPTLGAAFDNDNAMTYLVLGGVPFLCAFACITLLLIVTRNDGEKKK